MPSSLPLASHVPHQQLYAMRAFSFFYRVVLERRHFVILHGCTPRPLVTFECIPLPVFLSYFSKRSIVFTHFLATHAWPFSLDDAVVYLEQRSLRTAILLFIVLRPILTAIFFFFLSAAPLGITFASLYGHYLICVFSFYAFFGCSFFSRSSNPRYHPHWPEQPCLAPLLDVFLSPL